MRKYSSLADLEAQEEKRNLQQSENPRSTKHKYSKGFHRGMLTAEYFLIKLRGSSEGWDGSLEDVQMKRWVPPRDGLHSFQMARELLKSNFVSHIMNAL